MRELKFRSYCTDPNEEDSALRYSDKVNDGSLGMFFINSCDKCIVMQFTGLQDKNGKDIYEGDLCRVTDPYTGLEVNGEAKVVFSYEHIGGWVLTSDDINYLNIGTREKYVRVVGNIYENPELMERK